MASEVISTQHLCKVYKGHIGRPAVHSLSGLNLHVAENEIYGFLGQNGAGKTTTIKILCSLLRPTRGNAYIFGQDARRRVARRAIGYLPENPYFYEYLTPRETLDFYGSLQGMPAHERAREWKHLAELLELGPIAEQRVRSFSKGMRQRLAFAVALVGSPPVLILDEPMSGLDPLGRRMFRELMLRLHAEGKTLFFSSHVLSDVEQICSRVGVLVKGRLTSEGRLDELLDQRVQEVEVILDGLDAAAVDALAPMALRTRVSEAGRHFHMPGLDEANQLAREAFARGGRIVELSPVKESLEEYFMREQGGKEARS